MTKQNKDDPKTPRPYTIASGVSIEARDFIREYAKEKGVLIGELVNEAFLELKRERDHRNSPQFKEKESGLRHTYEKFKNAKEGQYFKQDWLILDNNSVLEKIENQAAQIENLRDCLDTLNESIHSLNKNVFDELFRRSEKPWWRFWG